MVDAPAPRSYGVNSLTVADLKEALAKGFNDFYAKPSHLIFLIPIYPVFGVMAWLLFFEEQRWPLLFPLAAGFALLGPCVALVFYELSRRRELGLEANWGRAIQGIPAPSILAMLTMTAVLLIIFAAWIAVAQYIYLITLGLPLPASIFELVGRVFTTTEGWQLLLLGNFAGFLFALVVLMISAVSFPMALDQPVSASQAMTTSVRVFFKNPVVMMIWGGIIAGMLAIGFAALLVGLAITLPVVGHATWHLYRKAVSPSQD